MSVGGRDCCPCGAAIAAPYPTPIGSPTVNGLAGFAKILCSAVFISGRDDAEAAQNSAYFFMPRDEQDKVTWTIDRDQTVTATFGADARSAKYTGDQGCIIQNPDSPGIHFTPVAVTTSLPPAESQPWPMGDRAGRDAAASRRERRDARRRRSTPRSPIPPR